MKSIMITSLAVILLIACVFYFFQRNLIYVPTKIKPFPSEYNASDMHEIKLITDDKLTLYSWYKPAVDGKPTILYMHGNAGHIGNRMDTVRPLLDKGYGVLLLEYRGYGGNPGQPSEQGLYTDARAAFHFLTHKGISPKKIVFYGESLGTGVATEMAFENQVCALILQTPFTSLTKIAHLHYPWLFFISPWDKFDSISKIKSIESPILILHGTADQVVPYIEGEKLYQSAIEPKKFCTFKGYQHNNLWHDAEFIPTIDQFIEQSYCQ